MQMYVVPSAERRTDTGLRALECPWCPPRGATGAAPRPPPATPRPSCSQSWQRLPGASTRGAHPPESVWRPSAGARSGRGWWPLAGSQTPCPRSSGQGETLRTRDTGYRRTRNGAQCSSGSKPWAGVSQAAAVPACGAFGSGVSAGQGRGQQALNNRGGVVSGAAAGLCPQREQTPPMYLRWPGTSCGTFPCSGHPRWLLPWRWQRQKPPTGRCAYCPVPDTRSRRPRCCRRRGGTLWRGRNRPSAFPQLPENRGSPHWSSPKTASPSSQAPGLSRQRGGPFPCSHPVGDK